MPQITQPGALTSASASITAGTTITGNLAFGTYNASKTYGALLAPSSLGPVTILNTGVITSIGTLPSALQAGILLAAGGVLTNTGSIAVTASTGYAVAAFGPATITNNAELTGPGGIYLPAGSVANSGTILATATVLGENRIAAITSNNAAGPISITNQGLAAGAYFAIALAGPAAITNTGTIRSSFAFGEAILLAAGGSLDNSGLIAGNYLGVSLGHNIADTLINSGTITATTPARSFHPHIGTGIGLYSSIANALTNTATGLITGAVTAIRTGNAPATITTAGTITGATTAISFAAGYANRLIIEPSAAFSGIVNGGNSLGSSIASTLELSGTSPGTLASLNTEFENFATIIIDPLANWTFSGTTTIEPGQTLIIEGSLNAVPLIDDGLILDPSLACFAAGTRILTPRGEIPVERLTPGDLVITATGADAPITWIGRRTITHNLTKAGASTHPIRIQAGAIAEAVPSRDLYLSPDHALYLGNHLVPAKALLNHRSIAAIPHRRITYYHIELARHAIIFAENTPVETYLETGNRSCFENAPITALHPDFNPRHFQAIRESLSCAPFTESGPLVEGLRTNLLRRAFNNQNRRHR